MLDVDTREQEVMLKVLRDVLPELRSTISNTENFDWRQQMKDDEEVIKGLIVKLETELQEAVRNT